MSVDVVARQTPLQQRYRKAPTEARIVERARTQDGVRHDPFHGRVVAGLRDVRELPIDFGIHAAIGGDHDLPNPGHLLAAALAACMDSTLRIIAARLGISLEALAVEVAAEADVRGTLQVERSVPVGFQCLRCKIDLVPADGTPESAVMRLIAAAERCCVNLQTLQRGVEVRTALEKCG